LVGELG
jgi:hypothetical protein